MPTPVRGVSIDGPFSGLVPPLGGFYVWLFGFPFFSGISCFIPLIVSFFRELCFDIDYLISLLIMLEYIGQLFRPVVPWEQQDDSSNVLAQLLSSKGRN